MRRGRAWLLVIAVATAMLAGCGLGAGPGTSDVTLSVTQDFGSRTLGRATARRVPGAETVMRMLERSFRVDTRYGGGFVESIDGRSGSSDRRDWFFYVNGIEASKGAAITRVHRGDEIWWDLHDWSGAQDTPAVVGSFPEPFIHGSAGRRLPTALECASDVEVACTRVTDELGRLHIPVASQLIGTGSGTESLALEVGTWRDLRGQIITGLVDQGPGSSGIFARFTAGGSELELLGPRGQVLRTLGSGAGLVAATAQGSSPPTWMVTGTDPTGVAAAAAALNQGTLHGHFALAVDGGADLPLPLEPAS